MLLPMQSWHSALVSFPPAQSNLWSQVPTVPLELAEVLEKLAASQQQQQQQAATGQQTPPPITLDPAQLNQLQAILAGQPGAPAAAASQASGPAAAAKGKSMVMRNTYGGSQPGPVPAVHHEPAAAEDEEEPLDEPSYGELSMPCCTLCNCCLAIALAA